MVELSFKVKRTNETSGYFCEVKIEEHIALCNHKTAQFLNKRSPEYHNLEEWKEGDIPIVHCIAI